MVGNSESIGQHPLGIKERSSHDLLIKEEREALEQSGPGAAQGVARKQYLLIKEALYASHHA